MAEASVISRMELITEQEDKNLAGAQKEIRNDLTVIIPENPFPEIELDAYPPLKFSWVVPKKIAAMALPRNRKNVQYLVNSGINHLITLSSENKPPVEDFLPQLKWTEIPIDEFDNPTLDQIKKFIDICQTGDVVGIHCRQGRARSGVMLACYMVQFHRFLPDQAVDIIRKMRTGSCEYPEHEEVVAKYYEHIQKDNPTKFGVPPEVIDDMLQKAKDCNKKPS